MRKPRNAIKNDLLAAGSRVPKIDSLGDPLVKISGVVDVAELASEVDRNTPRMVSAKKDRAPFPTETMARILALKLDHPVGSKLHEATAHQR